MSAPKFKLTVLGVVTGRDPGKVRAQLTRQLKMDEEQADALLANRAAVCQKLLPHEDAFKLRSALQEIGVDCCIKPVPLEGLAAKAGSLHLHQPAKPTPAQRAPVVRAPRTSPVRAGRTPIRAAGSTKGTVSVWPVVAMAALVVLASWLFTAPSGSSPDLGGRGAQVASILDSRAID